MPRKTSLVLSTAVATTATCLLFARTHLVTGHALFQNCAKCTPNGCQLEAGEKARLDHTIYRKTCVDYDPNDLPHCAITEIQIDYIFDKDNNYTGNCAKMVCDASTPTNTTCVQAWRLDRAGGITDFRAASCACGK